MSGRDGMLAGDAAQDAVGQRMSPDHSLDYREDVRRPTLAHDAALAHKKRFVRARFEGLLLGEDGRQKVGRLDVAVSPPLVPHGMQRSAPHDLVGGRKLLCPNIRQNGRLRRMGKDELPGSVSPSHLDIDGRVPKTRLPDEFGNHLLQRMSRQSVDQANSLQTGSQSVQVVLQPHGMAVQHLDDLVDSVAQLKTAVLDVAASLAQGHELPVQIQNLIAHLLTSCHE